MGMKKHSIPCVIFAGGKSSRMGEDKALKPFGQKSLAEYQYRRLREIFAEVWISTKKSKFPFPAPIIYDTSDIYAPTPAFLDIFARFDAFFAISVDAPFVDEDIIGKIVQEGAKYPRKDAIVAKTCFVHPLIGIYRKSILPILRRALAEKNYKLNQILQEADIRFVPFENEEKFSNLNYPHDFEKALQKLQNLL